MRKIIVGAQVSLDGVNTLTRSRVSSTGLMIGDYERDGKIKTGGTELDSPSEREIARQGGMKREG